MASIAGLLLTNATAAPKCPSSATQGAPGATAEGTGDDGADFSQILQAMLIGAGLLQLQATTPTASAAAGSEAAAVDPGNAAIGGIPAATDLPTVATGAVAALDAGADPATASVQAPTATIADIAQTPTAETLPIAPDVPAIAPHASDAAPDSIAAATLQEAPSIEQTATAPIVAEPSADASPHLDIEPPLRDEIEPAASFEIATLNDESGNVDLEALQELDDAGTELKAAPEKKDEADPLDAIGEAPTDAEPAHAASHAEAPHHVHGADAKPRVEPTSVAEQVKDRIVEHAETAREHGRVELNFDMHPPELGRLRLNLTSQDHSLNVRVWAENDQTRQLLANQMDALKQRLVQSGVSLGSLNVGRDSGGTRLPYKAPESSVQSATSASGDDATRSIARFRWAAGAGAVDVMA